MKKTALALVTMNLVTFGAMAEEPIPRIAPALPDSKEIYEKIIAKYAPMYQKFSGIEFKAETTTWMYDSETNELKETSEVIMAGVQPFYGKPAKPKILKYVKNGEALSPDDYPDRGGGGESMYPIFDAAGPEHYTIKVIDKTPMRRQSCLVLEVNGKEKTERHFEGTVYVNADTLALVFMDGGIADPPFGVDSMRFQYYLRQEGDLSIWESSTFTAVVDVPILFPDTRMVSKSKVIEARGLPK